MTRWLFVMAPVLALAGLAGCAGSGAPAPAELTERATESDQNDAERRARVRLELASAYYSRGQLETALDELKLSIATRPDLSEAYSLRGLVYAALGEAALAEASFKRALQVNPRDADAMHNYGWTLCQARRYAEAAEQFQSALAQPQYRNVARTLAAKGLCQGRAGQWLEAEGSLMRAFELEPANASTALNLSEVLYRRSDFERARFYIGRVNAQPDNVNAQTLWLALRIENKLGNAQRVREFGNQLRDRFPQAPEAQLYQAGRFDD
jgi:type IV pilus assembly protein PilF